MAVGLIGRKVGMTRVFTEEGASIPVTVIEAEPNRITQLKTMETDGYHALQVTVGAKKSSRVTRPEQGHYAKANVAPGRGLWEFRVDDAKELEGLDIGGELTVEHFKVGQAVDTVSVSKGKGFQGTIKKYNFSRQGRVNNSLAHRVPGSTGQNQTPGRVFKGKKMPGQMGNKRTTLQNQPIVKIDTERHLILVKGGVPGAPGSDVIIKHSTKASDKGDE